MALVLLTPPAAEPLSLAAAKHFLRVEHDDDDDLIATLVRGARGHIEARTRRALMTQTWRYVFDAWPPEGRIEILLAPLVSVSAVRIYDAAGNPLAGDEDQFVVDRASAPGRILFPPWAVAAPGRPFAGIELDIEAGYGDADDVPEPLIQALRLLIAHWYENRSLVGAGAHPPLPAAIDALVAPFRVVTL